MRVAQFPLLVEQAADPHGGRGRGGTSTGDFWVRKGGASENGPAQARGIPVVISGCLLPSYICCPSPVGSWSSPHLVAGYLEGCNGYRAGLSSPSGGRYPQEGSSAAGKPIGAEVPGCSIWESVPPPSYCTQFGPLEPEDQVSRAINATGDTLRVLKASG